MFKIGDRVRNKRNDLVGNIIKIGKLGNYVEVDDNLYCYSDFELVTESPQPDRPVLGLVPQRIWHNQIVELHKAERIKDISEAIKRYLDSGLSIPELWLTEYNDLLSEVSK